MGGGAPGWAPASLRMGPLSPSPGRQAASSSLPCGRKGLVAQEHAAWQVGARGSARALRPSWPSERPLPPGQPQLPTGTAAVPGPALGSVRPWGCSIEAGRGTNVPGPGRPRRGHQAPRPRVLSPRGPVGSIGRRGRRPRAAIFQANWGPGQQHFPAASSLAPSGMTSSGSHSGKELQSPWEWEWSGAFQGPSWQPPVPDQGGRHASGCLPAGRPLGGQLAFVSSSG